MLVAHGSRDPRSVAVIESLVRRIAAARPGLPVAAAYLEHLGPRPAEVVGALTAGGARTVVGVPLLLTAAYHGTVDVPAVVSDIRHARPELRLATSPVLGPDDALLDALDERLDDAGVSGVDGLVLAAAGTRDEAARRGVAQVAARYGIRHRMPCVAAYATVAGDRTVSAAVARLRSGGARRIVVASYFLAPGVLHDRIVEPAGRAGALAVTRPFGATRAVAALVAARYDRICDDLAGFGEMRRVAGGHAFSMTDFVAGQGVRLPALSS
jgi:sirohydrochlorin ferrochelatase